MYTDPNRAYYVAFEVKNLPGGLDFEGIRSGRDEDMLDRMESRFVTMIEERHGIRGFKVDRVVRVATQAELDRLSSGDRYTGWPVKDQEIQSVLLEQ